MRILIVAALTVCLSSAAWAGDRRHEHSCADGEVRAVSSEVDTAEILRAVDDALRDALADVAATDLSRERSAEIEAAISEAMAGLEADLATLDSHLDAMPPQEYALSAAQEERIDEHVDAAMERMEEALERMDERLDGAPVEVPKRWRPRY